MRSALAILFCAIAFTPIFAQTYLPDRVSVIVEGDTASRQEVASYLKRELRGLNDLVITDENPQFVISALIIPLESKAGDRRGYGLSVVVTDLSGEWLSRIIPPDARASCMAGNWALISGLMPYLVELEYHGLFVGGLDDLQALCRDAVTAIDTKVFEPRRSIIQKAKDRARKQ